MADAGVVAGDALPWLLEADSPGVRYPALRDLMRLRTDDPELAAARKSAHHEGPIAVVLDEMDPAGYWEKPGPGYNPKYRSTVWALILLAQLGAWVGEDERLSRACGYLLDHALTPNGQLSASGAPSGTVDCLQGNLCWALLAMGYDDPRLDLAMEWMARSITGEGVAPKDDRTGAVRYYAGQCGPRFACGANNGQACAWGAVKEMLALGLWPVERRTPLIERAIQAGVDFLLGVDPATAAYPSGINEKPSSSWWKFGFPVFYITDVLQIVEALTALGYGDDARLANARSLIAAKQDEKGRWPLEYSYTGKTWVDFGPKKQPNKWVTLRALRVLRSQA